jgi:protein-S-isoprenylcysteine O-methyltransferase Ste14
MALKEEFTKTGNWLFKWRGYFPLLIVPFLLIALREPKYLEKAGGPTAQHLWEAFCLAVSFTGLIVRCAVVGYAPKRTSGRNTERQKAETLNTTGFYSVARHPLYLGNFIIFLGMILFVQTLWFILLCILSFWLYYERIMFAEEEFLRERFGASFLRWSEKTPAFLPKFRNWKKPALSFSLKNILKREYTAFFLILTAFSALDILGDLFTHDKFKIEDSIWLILFMAGFIIYFILRTLKTKTKFLNVAGR